MDNRQQTTDNRRLVIRVGADSLAFSTTNDESQVIFVPYDCKTGITLAANMREALRTVPLLRESYYRVLVMVDSPVLMMPADLFTEDKADSLYQFAFTGQKQELVSYSILPDLSSVALFSVSKDLRTVLTDRFSDVRFSAALAPVWRHLNQRSYTGPRGKLYAYFHGRRMDVFCFTQNRFKFYNAFSTNTPDDMLYYLLSVWKLVGLVAEHDELHLVGDHADIDTLKEKASAFIKRVFIINPVGEFNRSAVTQIEGMPYDLMTLYIKGR